jgi:hypothetical protein
VHRVKCLSDTYESIIKQKWVISITILLSVYMRISYIYVFRHLLIIWLAFAFNRYKIYAF